MSEPHPAADAAAADVDPLTRIALRHGTDKWGAHFYTPVYHRLFAHLRDKPVRLLEIGVGGYEFARIGGASLAMWADYFPNGRILGIDFYAKTLDLGPRVCVRQGSQDDAAFLAHMSAEHGPFDIVIDDGSHVPAHVVASFNVLFPLLADGGLYVIEDVQTTFWPNFGGSLLDGDGGATMHLARRMLEHLNYAEFQVAQPEPGLRPGQVDPFVSRLAQCFRDRERRQHRAVELRLLSRQRTCRSHGAHDHGGARAGADVRRLSQPDRHHMRARSLRDAWNLMEQP